jgi:hypothetical protein
VDRAVDAARVLSLGLAILFPIPLTRAREIIPGGWQPTRASLLADFDGDTVMIDDFFYRLAREVSPPLIRCSRATE